MIRFHRKHRKAVEDFKRALVDLGQRAAMWEGSAKKLDADLRDTKAVLEHERNAHAETNAVLAAYLVRCERLESVLRYEYNGAEAALEGINAVVLDLDDVRETLAQAGTLLAGLREHFPSHDVITKALGRAEP
jgi:hypothetical protein